MTADNTDTTVGDTKSNNPNSDTHGSDLLIVAAANEMPVIKALAVDVDDMKDTDAALHKDEPLVVPPMRYQLLTGDELCKLPTFQWRIKGVLPAHGLAVMFGPSGSGKSFLVLDMLQSLALGNDWFGHKVKQCSLTYVALEGEAGVANRVMAYQVKHGVTAANIRYVTQPFNLLCADDINALAAAIQAAGTGDVVVLDTLSRATSGSDENDSKAMGQIISAATFLQELIGGVVVLIHHTGKDASKGMRGHSSLHAALDCAIEVRRNTNHREWSVAKSKDSEDGESHSFILEVLELGIDGDGEAVTSCVVVGNQSTLAIEKKNPQLGSNQKIALNALGPLLTNAIDINGEPQGKPSIRFEEALETITPLMPGGAKHQRERAKEALTGLVKHNVLAMNGYNLCMS